jgi:hypothetical protein
MRRVAPIGRRGERGQAIILVAGALTVVLAIAVIVIDFGLWLAERRELQRAADFAALAAALDLPNDDAAAVANGYAWAGKNDYTDGLGGVEVTVQLLCRNRLGLPPDELCSNANPSGGPSDCAVGARCDSVRVSISKPAGRLFAPLFGIDEITVSSGAAAGLAVNLVDLDAVVGLDVTGSMRRPPCDITLQNDGCPIWEARQAAHGFVDILLNREGGATQIGVAPYRGCYNPPRLFVNCVSGDNVIDLTADGTTVHAGIDAVMPEGATGTNVCLALHKSTELLRGPNAQPGERTRRFIVLLTDGDNTYNANSFGEGAPPEACRPLDAATSDEYTGTQCHDAQPREIELDVATHAYASEVKAQGIQVYVVGFAVCGADDGQTAGPAYCSGIGGSAHDNAADQRLLKCIASSPGHFHRVSSAEELSNIFQLIAWEIIGRGLVQ